MATSKRYCHQTIRFANQTQYKIKYYSTIMQVDIENKGKTPEQILEQYKRFLLKLPTKVGNIAVLFFKDNIRERQGFLDISIEGWESGKSGVLKKAGGKMLIEKGNLLSGITQSVSGTKVMVYIIGVAAKYAEIHNTGGTITVTPKMRKFFWAKYYENNKKIVLKKDGKTHTKASITINAIAQYYKNLALAKKLVIPKRKFIGNSVTLDNDIKKYIEDNLQVIFNG